MLTLLTETEKRIILSRCIYNGSKGTQNYVKNIFNETNFIILHSSKNNVWISYQINVISKLSRIVFKQDYSSKPDSI